jgi:hypothetical protein
MESVFARHAPSVKGSQSPAVTRTGPSGRGRRTGPQAEQCVPTQSNATQGSSAKGAGRHPETRRGMRNWSAEMPMQKGGKNADGQWVASEVLEVLQRHGLIDLDGKNRLLESRADNGFSAWQRTGRIKANPAMDRPKRRRAAAGTGIAAPDARPARAQLLKGADGGPRGPGRPDLCRRPYSHCSCSRGTSASSRRV